MKNYKVSYLNYIENDISLTDEPVGNYTDDNEDYEVFETLGKAKKSMLKIIRLRRDEMNMLINGYKNLNKSNLLED